MAHATTSRASQVLRKWLTDNGKSHDWLAQKVGVTRAAVSSWLSGTEPKVNAAVAVQRATGGTVRVEMWGLPAMRKAA